MSNSNAEKLQIKTSDHLSIALSSSSTSCRQTLIALTSLSLWSRQHERGSCAHAQVCVLTPFPASGCCCLPVPREQPPVREPWPFTAGYQPPEPLTLGLVAFGQGPNAKGILDVFPTASSRSFPFPEGSCCFPPGRAAHSRGAGENTRRDPAAQQRELWLLRKTLLETDLMKLGFLNDTTSIFKC